MWIFLASNLYENPEDLALPANQFTLVRPEIVTPTEYHHHMHCTFLEPDVDPLCGIYTARDMPTIRLAYSAIIILGQGEVI
ncbi:hypothetical protein BPAE_0164g00020 [Botrytis paeoniae]|uniref:Uncharacterized protein n=1 Tax=Botrytis paeoniae TaxID=278948 RepID=A0A4Z1FDE0_9HELO|nr:hypothetical protein BPAE_0164g00020 [Botrytis paeoniae]